MENVGEILRKVRISKKFSIDQVSNELKISKEFLNQLENNDIKIDKNIAYNIGHLKSYINFLDLDSDLIIKKFKEEISFSKNKVITKIPKPSFYKNSVNYQRLISVSIILIIFSSFYYLFIDKKNEIEFALVPDIPESLIPVIEYTDLKKSNIKSASDGNKIVSNTNNSSITSAVASNNINKPKISLVTLKILDPTWIQLRDNSDNIILSKLMEKDEEYNYDLDKNFNITAGNAGNILVLIDGKARGKIGKFGEILDSFILDYNFNN